MKLLPVALSSLALGADAFSPLGTTGRVAAPSTTALNNWGRTKWSPSGGASSSSGGSGMAWEPTPSAPSAATSGGGGGGGWSRTKWSPQSQPAAAGFAAGWTPGGAAPVASSPAAATAATGAPQTDNYKSSPRWRKRTKQLATLGPASSSFEMIEKLFLAGSDVFRLNFSHGEHAQKKELLDIIRAVEDKYDHPIAILGDLQGPKLRVSRLLCICACDVRVI